VWGRGYVLRDPAIRSGINAQVSIGKVPTHRVELR
jgi:hypothetical protein